MARDLRFTTPRRAFEAKPLFRGQGNAPNINAPQTGDGPMDRGQDVPYNVNGAPPTPANVLDGDYGDITVTVGTWLIDNNVVSNAKLTQMAQATIKGRAAGAGTGNVTDLSAAQVKTILALTAADIAGLGYFATGTDAANLTGLLPAARIAGVNIAPGNVAATGTVSGSNLSGTNTGDQFTAMTSSRLLGRYTAGFGVAQEIALSAKFSLTGGTLDVALGFADLSSHPTTLAGYGVVNINTPANDIDNVIGSRIVIQQSGSGNYGTFRFTDGTTDHCVIWGARDTDPKTYLDSDEFVFENLAESVQFLTLAATGNTSGVALHVPDDAYSAAGWDANTEVPTKNAVRDKIETLPSILDQGAAGVSHTGDTVETTLATITIPAGAMGINGRIEVRCRWSFSGTAGTKTPRIKFGATTIVGTAAGATITAYRHNAEVANRGAANSQYTYIEGMNSSAASLMTTGTAAIDTTAAVNIAITGQLAAAADTIKLESYQVLLFPKA